MAILAEALAQRTREDGCRGHGGAGADAEPSQRVAHRLGVGALFRETPLKFLSSFSHFSQCSKY